LVNIGRLSEADIHVCATLEVDSVFNSTLHQNRGPANKQQNTAESKEILGLAHPIDVGLFEELDHAVLYFPSLDSKALGFVPDPGTIPY
jgi:hypothetical protein